MDEQERLELEVKQLKEEIRQLLLSKSLGNLEDENIIKEKRNELFKASTSLELCKINNEGNNVKRR